MLVHQYDLDLTYSHLCFPHNVYGKNPNVTTIRYEFAHMLKCARRAITNIPASVTYRLVLIGSLSINNYFLSAALLAVCSLS